MVYFVEFFKRTKVAQIYALFFPQWNSLFKSDLTISKYGFGYILVNFLQTHLVNLAVLQF
jgi:hypothetical protein